MAEGDRADLAIAAAAGGEPPAGGASKVKDFKGTTEWTDERHRLFLNSIEASFVSKLHNKEYGSNNFLGWLSRTNVHANSSASNPKANSSGQFKVLRRGCWEEPKVERVKGQTEIENKLSKIHGNHWIQHFRSHPISKKPRLTVNQLDGSTHLINQRHGGEATTSSQQPPSPLCSQKIHEFFTGGITEVSDQNFVDVTIQTEESSKRRSKKRARDVISQITDQVVPFMAPISDEKAPAPKYNKEDRREKNLDDTGDSLQASHSSLFREQRLSDPKFDGG